MCMNYSIISKYSKHTYVNKKMIFLPLCNICLTFFLTLPGNCLTDYCLTLQP